MEESKATYSGPFEVRTAFIVLPVLALLGLLVALPLCSNLGGLSDSGKELLLGVFITGLACGWFAFTGTETKVGFVGVFFLSLMIASLLIAMAHSDSGFPFWMALLSMVFTAVVGMLDGEKDRWENLLTSLYIMWVVVGVVVTLGSEDFFQYAKPALKLSEIHPLLELRYLLSVLFLSLSLVHAVRNAFLDDRPKIPVLPSYALPDVSAEMHPILRPVFQALQVVLNLLFLVIITVTNIVWTLLATVAAYFIRTGKNLAFRFYQSLSDGTIWQSIARILLTFGLVFLFARGILPALPKLIRPYLTVDLPFYFKTWDTLVVLIEIGGLALLVLFCIAFIWALWQNRKGVLEIANQGLFGLAMMVFAFALSGAGMYGMARINSLDIVSFRSLGLFLFLAIVFVGLGSVIIFKLAFQSQKSNASQADATLISAQGADEGNQYQKEKASSEGPALDAQNNWVRTAFAALVFIGLTVAISFLYSPAADIETKNSKDTTGKADSVSTFNQDSLLQKTPPALQDTVAATDASIVLVSEELEREKLIERTEGDTAILVLSKSELKKDETAAKKPESQKPSNLTAENRKGRVQPPATITLRLRNKGITLSEEDVKTMLVDRAFYDHHRNWKGKGGTHSYEPRTIAGEYVVIDHATGLMWQQAGSSYSISFADAQNYIRDLNDQRFAGYNDWRLPTLEEAMSLMEPATKTGNSYIDQLFAQEQLWIWTADNQNALGASSSNWVVSFSSGRCTYRRVDLDSYVRLVR